MPTVFRPEKHQRRAALVLTAALTAALTAVLLVTLPCPAQAADDAATPDDPAACLAYWEGCAGWKGEAPNTVDTVTAVPELLRLSRCLAFRSEHGKDKSRVRKDVAKGFDLAQAAVKAEPDNGEARYMLAYFMGLKADLYPLSGLGLVPDMEREAKTAERLAPAVNCAGPARMLGELYLRAPGSPISIGDPHKAVEELRRAVVLEPRSLDNRVLLAEALLGQESAAATAEACGMLRGMAAKPAAELLQPAWEQAGKLRAKHCTATQ